MNIIKNKNHLVRVLVVVATEAEADSLKNIKGIRTNDNGFTFGRTEICLLITGVGSVSTSWSMTKWLSENRRPDLAVNIGIAGSYREEIRTGNVVVPVTDCFADAGIETGDGFMTLSEAGLADPDMFPFSNGLIKADNHYTAAATAIMKPVNAITVNTATGSEKTRERLVKKYNPDIETMEGATFFYICSQGKIPFLGIRSISNRVEPRNRKNWDITLALDNLTEKLSEYLIKVE